MEFEDYRAKTEDEGYSFGESDWDLLKIGWDSHEFYGDKELCEAEGCYKLGRYNYGGMYACCLPHAERAAM